MKIPTLIAALALACLAVPASAQVPNASGHDPTIKPGDVVRIAIWREPDMSGDFNVDEAGTVVFPLVGEYHVLSDTPESLREKLLVDYRKYLKNPSIQVTVLRRVRITGAVMKPGLYPVDPTVTLADAIAMAGGPTPIGKPDKVRIIRDGKTVALNITRSTRIADLPLQSGDDLYVPERSWISIHSNVVATTIGATVTLIIFFLRR